MQNGNLQDPPPCYKIGVQALESTLWVTGFRITLQKSVVSVFYTSLQ